MVARSTSGVISLRGSDPYAHRDQRSSSVGSLSVWHSGVCARMAHAGLSEHEPSKQYESSHRSVPTLSCIRPDLVSGREEFVKTALSVLIPALGDAKALIRELETWQRRLDPLALKLAPLPSGVWQAAAFLPRSPLSIRDCWDTFVRTVFSAKEVCCAPMAVDELRRQAYKAAACIDESLAGEVVYLIFEHDDLNAQRLAVLSSGQGLSALVKESFTLYRERQHERGEAGRRILCNPQEEPETIKRDVPQQAVVPALEVLTNVVSHVVSSFEVHWQLARMLGRGAQGAVWEARNRVDSTRSVAVKLAKAGDAEREIAAYRHLRLFERHPNVLEFHFAFRDQWHVNLGIELCKIDLCDLVVTQGGLAEAEARVWVRQLVAAVTYLHACDVVHLDIKLDNMFITHAGYLKLGDLGSAIVCFSSCCTSFLCGTKYYAAPEMLMTLELGRYQGRAADVWSIGVSACVMVSCVFPFRSDRPVELYKRYIQGLHTPLVLDSPKKREPYSSLLLQLLDECLAIDPAGRPSASVLGEMPWLASLARPNRAVKREASHDTFRETGEHNRRVMARLHDNDVAICRI